MLSSIDPEWIGYIGAFFTATSYMPQAVKVIREKHTKSISIIMYFMQLIGVVAWLIYATMINSSAVMAVNLAILVMVLVIIATKLRYG